MLVHGAQSIDKEGVGNQVTVMQGVGNQVTVMLSVKLVFTLGPDACGLESKFRLVMEPVFALLVLCLAVTRVHVRASSLSVHQHDTCSACVGTH